MTPYQLAMLLELARHPDKTIVVASYHPNHNHTEEN